MGQYELYAILVFLIALLLYLSLVFSRSKKKYAFPQGETVYGDLKAEGRILRSRTHGLSGKPDKVVQNKNLIIPYEYKSTNASRPREGHMLQMAAYFLILEENYPDNEVKYGVLKYKNYAFRIENSDSLKRELFMVMKQIRSGTGMPERNHNNRGRCAFCSFRETCLKKLIK